MPPYGNLPVGTLTPDHLRLIRQLADLQVSGVISGVLTETTILKVMRGRVEDVLIEDEPEEVAF